MVVYICLIPNKGARIGHQSDDYFRVVTFCKKNNFHYVYHPFTCNSEIFENVLKFKTLHQYNYENTIDNIDKFISIDYLVKLQSSEEPNILNQLIELHKSTEKIMLFDSIYGNENYQQILNFNINDNDIIETKKNHKNCLLPYYKNFVLTDYICVHLRCGDIQNDMARYLSVNYFIDKYNYLISQFSELKELPVYIITESNFMDDTILYEQIVGCNIIKTDEISSFYFLVNCKYLIASRSGFSNLAYILGNMKVIKPPHDWNCYWDNLID